MINLVMDIQTGIHTFKWISTRINIISNGYPRGYPCVHDKFGYGHL